MILDSSFIIDLLQGRNAQALERAHELDAKFIQRAISSVTAFEVWKGIARTGNSHEKEKVERLISSLIIYSFGIEEGKIAAYIEADLEKRGEIIDLEDIFIAATAIHQRETLLTKNQKHFRKIAGLNIETY